MHSVSAGLDYPGVGPEHSYWKDTGRVQYTPISDQEALAAFDTLAKLEGILPALESSHAVAQVLKTAGQRKKKTWSSSASPVAATKTSTKSPVCGAKRFEICSKLRLGTRLS